jgi:two-component system, NtrC family, sensor kinase
LSASFFSESEKQIQATVWPAREGVLQLLDALGQGGVYQSADGKIISANSSAERVLGLPLHQLQKRTLTDPFWKVIQADGCDFPEGQHPSILAIRTANVISDVVMGIYQWESGKINWYQVTAIPEKLPGQEELWQVCTVFTDITRFKLVENRLNERTKELQAFYALSEIAEMKDIGLDEMYQRIIDILPKSWKYPDIACGLLWIYGKAYTTENFCETPWKLSSIIFSGGNPVGYVEIGYLEDRILEDEGPFLKDERMVLDAIAERIGRIAERKEMVATIETKNEFLELALKASNMGTWQEDFLIDQLFLDETARLHFGCPDSIVTEKDLVERIHPDDLPRFLNDYREVKGKGVSETVNTELRILHPDRSVRWLAVMAKITFARMDDQFRPVFSVGTTQDITERKQAEIALRQTEETQRGLLEAITESVLLIKPDGTGILANSETLQRLGITRERFYSGNVFDNFPPKVAAFRKSMVERVLQTRQPIQFEDKRFEKNILNSIVPILDAEGNVSQLAIFGFDITARVHAEAGLRESESRFRMLIEAGPLAIIVAYKGIIHYANKPFIELFGYGDSRELVGRSIPTLYVPEIQEDVSTNYLSWIAGEEPGFEVERTAIRKDGKRFDVHVNIKKVPLQQDWAEIAFYTDITERKRHEEELAKYHEHLEDLVKELTAVQGLLATEKEVLSITLMSIGDGVIVTDKNGLVTLFNHSAEQITGYSQTEALEMSLQTVFQLRDSNSLEAVQDPIRMLKDMEKAQKTDASYRSPVIVTRSGKKILVTGSISTLRSARDEAFGHVIVFQDITEKHELESQTILSQKMEAIGQLAAGIAHEINTPIQYIGDNLKFLSKAFDRYAQMLTIYHQSLEEHLGTLVEPGDLAQLKEIEQQKRIAHYAAEVPNAIEEALGGTERVRKIVLAMREFSHPSEKGKKMADINHGIETTIAISRNEWKYYADMQTDLEPDLPLVNCQIDEINQVILNIIVNASQAIQEKIVPGSEQKELIAISTCHDPKRVLITIRDTGPGIPDPVRARIFDPFFTTKGAGKGTGQGLSLAHNIIVNKHHGKISVDTEVGRGTVFSIELPLEPEDESED